MSIAFESVPIGRIERRGLHHGMPQGSVFDPEGIFTGDRRLLVKESLEVRAGEERESSSSSSIGENSDCSDGERDSGEGEVQSSCKGPLDALEVLEEILPIKRGVSKFYNGKSKSFTSLEDATCTSSIKDIAKPENAFTRKRKNLLAHSIFFDKNREKNSRIGDGGLMKKPASSNHLGPSSPVRSRPPLHPQRRKLQLPINESITPAPPSFSPWRSFSLSDLTCSDMKNSGNGNGNGNVKIAVLRPNLVEE